MTMRYRLAVLTFVAPAARVVDPSRDLRHVAIPIVVRTAGGVSTPSALTLLTYL